MKPERLGRLAASCIIAVIAGVEFLASCKNPLVVVRWWLVFAIASGVFLNSRAGERVRYLAVASIGPGIVPLIVLAYPVIILGQDACFSGVQFSQLPVGTRIGIVAFFFVVSWIGIFLFSFTRNALLALLKLVASDQAPKTLRQIEATIRAVCALVGACVLLYAKLH